MSARRLGGRHRRTGTAFDVTARLGSLVTLAALLVLAGAVGGLADGVPIGEDNTVTATFGR